MEKKVTAKDVENLLSVLNDDQRDLLRFVIRECSWGDGYERFLAEDGSIEEDGFFGYFTNVTEEGYNKFSGRKIAGMFRSIYNKLCGNEKHTIGNVLSHCNDWWGDGSGDMLFIRHAWYPAFEKWAGR